MLMLWCTSSGVRIVAEACGARNDAARKTASTGSVIMVWSLVHGDPAGPAKMPAGGLHPGAAVDAQDLTRHPRRVVGREIERRLADVRRLAHAAERNGLRDPFADEPDQALAHVRADEARRDAV